VLAVAAPRYRGATIGLYSCVGFGAGFLGTLLFGVTLDQFGGISQLAAWIRQLRHLRTRLLSRRGRDDVPAPRRLETIAISCIS
jgi:hypothetical protein